MCNGTAVCFLLDRTKVPHTQWPNGLRFVSVAACFLEFWFPIPPEVWMYVVVSVVFCHVKVSASIGSLIQRSPTECGVV
jgi:hypothetical protein